LSFFVVPTARRKMTGERLEGGGRGDIDDAASVHLDHSWSKGVSERD
jgi:hypothetical protein